MFPNFLTIPFRILDDIDLKSILSDIIKKDFFQPASAFAQDIDQAQKLHTSVANASKSEQPDLNLYERDLIDYYFLVSDIANKFPDGVVTFEWYGTLGYKPTRCLVSSWKGHQHLLIFQLAILYCQKANLESPHTDEGIKAACSYFMLAAGCFELLLKDPIQLIDFDNDTLTAMRLLMLSHAQELIWQKAVGNPTMKNTLIARLAIKVSEFYRNTSEYASNSDRIVLDWINYTRVKLLHFKAAAHYRMSIVALDNFEYGVQVGQLRVALHNAEDANKYKRYVIPFVLEDLSGLTSTIQETLRTAEKDNDLIYLKAVPGPAELPAISGVSMVEATIPPAFQHRENIRKLFLSLLPFSIIQVAQAFRERQDKYIIKAFHEPIQALTRMLSHFLSERDLPAAIDAIQKPESLPESIIHHAQEIMAIGGVRIIEDSMAEISNLASNCHNLVHDCEERLRIEKYEDDLMRNREGTARWTREPSHVAASELSARVEKMNSYLLQGHQSDILIGDSYASIKETLTVYCKGHSALVKQIPKSSAVKLDAPVGELVAHLRDLLAEVDKCESSRQRFLRSIDVKSREHNVLPVVIGEYKKSSALFQNEGGAIEPIKFEPIYERHLNHFKNDLEYVEKSREQQLTLEEKISEVNQAFVQTKQLSYNSAQLARLKALQRYEEAYVQYLELISNLNQASTFYSDFLDKGNVVLREMDEYLYNRREEARELEISIRNQEKFHEIEQTMARPPSKLIAPASQKPLVWDPSKNIRFG